MLHYGMVSNNGMLLMHITLWHGINACYTMAWYQYMSHYSTVPMHVTLLHDVTLWNGTYKTMAWY